MSRTGRFRVVALVVVFGFPLFAVAQPLEQPRRYFDGSATSPLHEALTVAKRRNAKPVPFELKYLPPCPRTGNGPHAVLAVRPCAVSDSPNGAQLAKSLALDAALITPLKAMFHLNRVRVPELSAIDMVLTQLQCDVKPSSETEQGAFNCGLFQFVIRTREPYDWNTEFDQRSPAKSHKYRDVTYRVAEAHNTFLLPPGAPEGPIKVAFYVPDDRTLVIAPVWEMEALIDRLLDDKPLPNVPHWEAMNTAMFAFCAQSENRQWTRFLPGHDGPRLPVGGDWEWEFFDDLAELNLAIFDKPTTQLWLRASAGNPLRAARLTRNASRLRDYFLARLTQEQQPASRGIQKLLESGRFTRTTRGFEFIADAKADLIQSIVESHLPATPEVPLQENRFPPTIGTIAR